MKRISTLLLLSILFAVSATAQDAPSRRDRQKWLEDIREYKHNYLEKELQLTQEQAVQFFELYDKMCDEISQLNDEVRQMEIRVYEADESANITETEYEAVTQAIINAGVKEADIRNNYYTQFADIISKKQIFMLNKAERDFNMQLLRRHQQRRHR